MTTTEVGVGGGGGERLSFPSHYPPPLTTICHPLSHYFFPSLTLSHLYPPTHPSHPPIHPPPPFSHHVGMSTEDMLKEIAIKVKRNKMKADIRGADQLQDMYQSR